MFSYCKYKLLLREARYLVSDPGTLDGLGAAAALSIMNYFLLGWGYNIDRFYEQSFEIWLACTVVFPIAGCLGFSLLEYRLGQRSLHYALFENFLWMPFL